MNDFIERIKRLGVCKEYADKVESIGSKKSLIDVALSAGALQFVCEAICKEHIKPEDIRKQLASFINGKYVRDEDDYTSTIWCYPDNVEIKIDSTCALIICHDGEIIVDRPIAELYLVHSDCTIKGAGIAKVYLYNSSVVNPDNIVSIETQMEFPQ